MRWRPQKDDGEEVNRGQVEPVRHSRPPHHGRNGSRGATDHDVLHRPPLQPQGVHEHVEEQAAERQGRGQHLDRKGQQEERAQPEPDAKDQRVGRRDPAIRQRTAASPQHLAVEVAIDPAVDGAGAGRRQGAPQQGQHDQSSRRPAALGDHHPAERRDQQKRDDSGFGEAHVVQDHVADGAACRSSAVPDVQQLLSRR